MFTYLTDALTTRLHIQQTGWTRSLIDFYPHGLFDLTQHSFHSLFPNYNTPVSASMVFQCDCKFYIDVV